MTTSSRFSLLSKDMDIDAGMLLPDDNNVVRATMEKVAFNAAELLFSVASGRMTTGEKQGHSQCQPWRD